MNGKISLSLIIVFGYLIALSIAAFYYFKPIQVLQLQRDTQRKQDVKKIQASLESYFHYHGRYPPNPQKDDYTILGPDGQGLQWGSPWPTYIDPLPKDPQYPDRTYVYIDSDNYGQTYYLYASLERGVEEKDACNNGKACINVPKGVECGFEHVCNYGVSSNNVTP